MRSLIIEYGFVRVGTIVSASEQRLRFTLEASGVDFGWIYLWVESCKEGRDSVVYVGKAGRSIASRCAQHEAGFRHSVTGKAHAIRLATGLESGKSYHVWARKAQVIEMHGESGISLAGAEEAAFIQKFRPAWNSLL